VGYSIEIARMRAVDHTPATHLSCMASYPPRDGNGVKKLVGLLARRIQCRLKNSGAAFNRVRPWSAAHFRITNQPTRAMTGNIKLGHDANAAVASISDDLTHLILCVEETIRTERMKFGKLLAFDAETLVLSQMPVKDVQLDCRHRIEVPFEHFHRLVMTADIDQQAAPGKPRLILNLNTW